jgi:hypothetical protein
MSQIRLKNCTGGISKIGELVKINPKNPKGFVYVKDLMGLPVVGVVAQSVPNGNSCLITLLGGGGISDPSWSTITGTPTTLAGYGITDSMPMIISPTQPTNPTIGMIWINSSET